jgi:hypothetical protein
VLERLVISKQCLVLGCECLVGRARGLFQIMESIG